MRGRCIALNPAAAGDFVQANGIRYDLPITGTEIERASTFMSAVRPNGLSWTGAGHTLEVADGKITLDGRPHGRVQSGDVVKLTADGQLFVNGERRQPDA